jgi:serine/threonine protein kinase
MEKEVDRRIGKYITEKQIGRGAMGVVFLAKDPTIGRNVAIKCIHIPQGIEEDKVKEFRERFLREARAAGLMSHPNIVTVYEADEGSSNYPPFIAMEFIDGETWNKKIKRGEKVNCDTLLSFLKEIASALDYAHKLGVIHRDIKPGNIIQTVDNRIKLMDFGIAKVPTSELTREGQFLGTPAYMSPEQVLGKAVDKTCDLFSLGVVAYEMISGKKPFDGEDMAVVLHKIVNEEPQDLRELNPEVSKEAWAIIKKLLRKKKEERYQNAGELIADIDAYLAGALPPYSQDLIEKTVPPKDAPDVKSLPTRKPLPKAMIYSVVGVVLLALVGVAILVGVLIREKNRYDYGVVLPDEIKNVSPSEQQTERKNPKEEIKVEDLEPQKGFEPEKKQQQTTKPQEKPKPKTPVKESPSSQTNSPKNNQQEKMQNVQQQPATLNFTFDFGGTMKGSAELVIDDGKIVKTKKVEKGLFAKKEIWNESIQIPSGKHKIKIIYRAEIAGYYGTNEDVKEFPAGKTINLKVKIHKTKKMPIFEWSE